MNRIVGDKNISIRFKSIENCKGKLRNWRIDKVDPNLIRIIIKQRTNFKAHTDQDKAASTEWTS